MGTPSLKQSSLYQREYSVEETCGGQRSRTVMADEATRPVERWRPVPTGNILRDAIHLPRSIRFPPILAQVHESGYYSHDGNPLRSMYHIPWPQPLPFKLIALRVFPLSTSSSKPPARAYGQQRSGSIFSPSDVVRSSTPSHAGSA